MSSRFRCNLASSAEILVGFELAPGFSRSQEDLFREIDNGIEDLLDLLAADLVQVIC